MKVVKVYKDKVVVIIKTEASETKQLSKRDILGDLKEVTFDEEERIDIILSRLRQAYESDKIYRVYRGRR